MLGVSGWGLVFHLGLALKILHLTLLAIFTMAVVWRGVATAIAKTPNRMRRLAEPALPSYTVIVPLYREASMVADLSEALAALDYPKARLQILIVLEADDAETLSALNRTKAARAFDIVVAPQGAPKTKPRACNIALERANGQHVVIYDAEDRPHPLQLQEAAARFSHGDAKVACLQAPLRIASARGFLARQFALEYATQFEIMLPALAGLGLPFPLGGTSNHFRTAVLKSVGGWDAWNVTEDADLGFRLSRQGWRAGMLRSPTWESASARFKDWRPQRTRWVQGYMQTWGVHMRTPLNGGARQFIALQATLGQTILSAVAHGPIALSMIAGCALALLSGHAPGFLFADMALLTGGWGGAVHAMTMGAKRAGLHMRMRDAIAAPLYWALQSVAALFAIGKLCTRPHHWNKTSHKPAHDPRIGARASEAGLDAKGAASVRRAA